MWSKILISRIFQEFFKNILKIPKKLKKKKGGLKPPP